MIVVTAADETTTTSGPLGNDKSVTIFRAPSIEWRNVKVTVMALLLLPTGGGEGERAARATNQRRRRRVHLKRLFGVGTLELLASGYCECVWLILMSPFELIIKSDRLLERPLLQ